MIKFSPYIHKWEIIQPLTLNKIFGCVVLFAGRGMSNQHLSNLCEMLNINETIFVLLEPFNRHYYPSPNGINDQERSIIGLEKFMPIAESTIEKIQEIFDIPRQEIVVGGFSAGAVIALQLALLTKTPYAAAISMAGAIFETEKIPKAKHQFPILLQHNKDDSCFDWYERFIPMKESLITNKYNVLTSEKNFGGHNITTHEVELLQNFLPDVLNYPKDK